MKKAIIIARGATTEDQVKRCETYAKEKGYDVRAVTESIYNIFEPILNGEIDVILTTDISRITRKQREMFKIREVLVHNAVDLVFVPEPTEIGYDETVDILRKYGRELYLKLRDIDELFAGRMTRDYLKTMEYNPYNANEKLNEQARTDYMNGKIKAVE